MAIARRRKRRRGIVVKPFKADPADHCETPLRAYEDIAPVLKWLGGTLYDPYYCAGGAKRRLGQLGFDLHHKNVDCYKTWDKVEFDVLITNPPYSGEHLERLACFCADRSFLWLVPEWVHKKDYFKTSMEGKYPLFLSPPKRYIYEPPPGYRVKTKSDTHKKTAPFHSIWIVWAGSQTRTDALASFCRHHTGFRIARSKSQLRDLRR